MKTACIFHSVDLDGWISAAIVKSWFCQYREGIDEKYEKKITNEKFRVIKVVNNQTFTLDFFGFKYGDQIPDLDYYDRIIMCDISFPDKDMFLLDYRLGSNFIWIDHHISAINAIKLAMSKLEIDRNKGYSGLQDTNFAACELTWKYFFPDKVMPEIVRLLGRYDCFGHKGTSEEQKVLEFQYGARAFICGVEDAYNHLVVSYNFIQGKDTGNVIPYILDSGKSIYLYLKTEAIQVYYKGFEVTLYEPIKEVGSVGRKFILFNKERFNPINFDIDYHSQGYDGAACFWYDNGKWFFSLYNDNGEVDCSQIASQFGGGGHKGAAGFAIEDLHRIIK